MNKKKAKNYIAIYVVMTTLFFIYFSYRSLNNTGSIDSATIASYVTSLFTAGIMYYLSHDKKE